MTPAEPRAPSPGELNQHPDHRREKSSVGVLGTGQTGDKDRPSAAQPLSRTNPRTPSYQLQRGRFDSWGSQWPAPQDHSLERDDLEGREVEITKTSNFRQVG